MSIPGERDESMERWLQQLRPNQRENESCLDAETAASWMAGSLSGDALQQAQTHLADCDRCQALIGSLVRADVGGKPQQAAERTWLRWLVPVTAAATAIIAFGVWTVLPRQPSDPGSTVVENTALKETAPVQEPPPATTPADERAGQAAQALAPPVPASGAVSPMASGGPPAPKAEEARARRDAAGRQELEAAKSPPATAAPPQQAAQTFADAAPARAQSQTAEALLPDILTPDQAVRWRISGRQVQRSLDRGASWETVQVGAPAAFTAGSAPSRTVCWLVGRGGIVLLTTNGATFNRVPFPEPADLLAVSAADARSAMVTTSDGRTFRTSDGGRTWTR